MPPHKITFLFEPTVGATGTSGSRNGWSESWYQNADETDQQCLSDALLFKGDRRALLTPGWTMSEIRIAQLDSSFNLTRKGLIYFIPPANGKGTYPGTSQDEQPYDGLVWALSTANGNRRAFVMRGIPQEAVNAGARYLDPAAFRTASVDWINDLAGRANEGFFASPGPFSVRYKVNIGSFAVVGVSIANGTLAGSSPQAPAVLIQMPPGGVIPDALVGGVKVQLQNVLGLQGLNGTWTVASVMLPGGPLIIPPQYWIQLKPKRRKRVQGSWTEGGQASFYSWAMTPFTDATPGYGTSRRTGRPSILPRGRRSSRQS